MSHLKMIKEVLEGQVRRGIKSGDWEKLKYSEEVSKIGITLSIECLNIGFVFTPRGKLIGAYN